MPNRHPGLAHLTVDQAASLTPGQRLAVIRFMTTGERAPFATDDLSDAYARDAL